MKGLTSKIKLTLLCWMLVAPAITHASANIESLIPFSGTYQSLGSEARELTSRKDKTWTTIPQNVYLGLVQDQDIVELQLEIEVLDDKGRKLYPIRNSMWLRHVGNNQLEVYKLSKSTSVFEKVGDGECCDNSCSYEYVILAQNNGNPYQQRYMSTIFWEQDQAGISFSQSGSLSAMISDAKQGQDPWLVFKTWSNRFEAAP